MYYSLEPEVAGSLGNNTVIDSSTHPPKVKHLHYELDGYLGDDLLESFPCYIVSKRLKQAISGSTMTGFSFAEVEISTSEQFQELHFNREIPEFVWLKICGQAGIDDFGVSSDYCLVISKRALKAIKDVANLKNCDIKSYQPR